MLTEFLALISYIVMADEAGIQKAHAIVYELTTTRAFSSNDEIRALTDALVEIGPDAVTVIVETLNDGDDSRYRVNRLIATLGRFEDARVFPVLVDYAQHENFSCCVAAYNGLARYGTPEAVDTLFTLYSTAPRDTLHRWEIRRATINNLRNEASIPYLIELVDIHSLQSPTGLPIPRHARPHPLSIHFCDIAIPTLGKMQARESLPVLANVIDFGTVPHIRQLAVFAIANIDKQFAIEKIQEHIPVEDSEHLHRSFWLLLEKLLNETEQPEPTANIEQIEALWLE